ncbi:hypothetical protein BCR36DRAFT_375745 [Piromyces finnis]|uniref:Uncharacterized protein n=1 Tax=Piromyces finnis TaxID=1754191 RepID=A0A1Y1UER3_9FUNG|nr:hypothetical protein BCR36DRAFT_375745 [Piromyces finnis]|eukprot:ORX36550.1 hypothetical protein BCR36DRAFT_375745 [Piromyces finnis]
MSFNLFNFSIYPDPRNTWDDENVERKTFLDLFKPNINIQPRISYKHFDKRKGFISKKSKKDIPIMDISLVYNDHENENLYDVLGKEGKYTPSPNAIPMKKDHESCSYNNIYFNQGKKGNEYTNDYMMILPMTIGRNLRYNSIRRLQQKHNINGMLVHVIMVMQFYL